MYVIEVKNATGTAEKRCRSREKAVKIAALAASTDYIYISNSELTREQKRFEVKSVRVYDTKNPDIDIEF